MHWLLFKKRAPVHLVQLVAVVIHAAQLALHCKHSVLLAFA